MNRTNELYCSLFFTALSVLIAGSFYWYGAAQDPNNFWVVGFISGMFSMLAAHGAAVTWNLHKEITK